jgi:hypothetical protein
LLDGAKGVPAQVWQFDLGINIQLRAQVSFGQRGGG